jgi:hypothetical protein
MRRRQAALALLAALFCGCASPSEPFATLAAGPRLLAGDVPEAATVAHGVEVKQVSHLIFWVPTDGQPPTLEQAVNEALERGRGHLLVNATVERVAWYVPFVYGEYGWIVRGDVVRLHDPRPRKFDTDLAPHDADADGDAPAPDPRDRPAEAPPES